MTIARHIIVTLIITLLLCACGASKKTVRKAEAAIAAHQVTALDCDASCAEPSPVFDLVERVKRNPSQHYVALVEGGEESLALRLNLIRAATRSIEIQSFILSADFSGNLVMHELIRAAKRGVQVRIITDQLFSIDSTRLLTRLAFAHKNLQIKLYNPTFKEARTAPLEFAAGIICCFTRFNQRMHNKLMLVDDVIGITGGRNIDDRYFDMAENFIYRDRDVLVVGSTTQAMKKSFEQYWQHENAVALQHLSDISKLMIEVSQGTRSIDMTPPLVEGHLQVIDQQSRDAAFIRERFVDAAFAVNHAEYFSDAPGKHDRADQAVQRGMTESISQILQQAEQQIWMQTPYMVLSKAARKIIEARRAAFPNLQVIVSTNSLASTDAFYVYAISYKYKRRYMTGLGAEIYEYKPFTDGTPPSAEVAAQTTKIASGYTRLKRRQPVPLVRPGVRRGMHAKSIVIDQQVSIIGSHNFDPRSDNLNTESGLLVRDEKFALALVAAMQADIQPDQSWVIAPRPHVPVLSQINGLVERVSEILPVLDLWPLRYHTSYQLKQGCQPRSPYAEDFAQCYEAVGDFPLVAVSLKQLYTRIILAFGVALSPIL